VDEHPALHAAALRLDLVKPDADVPVTSITEVPAQREIALAGDRLGSAEDLASVEMVRLSSIRSSPLVAR
jgi:hypothetical protein